MYIYNFFFIRPGTLCFVTQRLWKSDKILLLLFERLYTTKLIHLPLKSFSLRHTYAKPKRRFKTMLKRDRFDVIKANTKSLKVNNSNENY